MILRQTFKQAVTSSAEFDGTHKTFDWSIDYFSQGTNKQGKLMVHVGSWLANRWYDVAVGKTEKQTLSNAKRKIQAIMARKGYQCTFEYIEE